MKQHITLDQLNELSEEGKEKLRKWCFKTYPKGFLSIGTDSDCTNPLLSIGQMIEFLRLGIGIEATGEKSRCLLYFDIKNIPNYELCDLLWEAVKEKLK